MRENKKLILGLIVFFIILVSSIVFLGYRLSSALENQHEIDQLNLKVQKASEQSNINNAYYCDRITTRTIKAARCIVEERTKEQEESYLDILTNNPQIVTAKHSSQTRTGFSDGIYGENNFAKQYDVKGEINPYTVYQYRMEFDPRVSTESLNDDQLATLNYYDANLEVSADEYATVLNPQASYQTLHEANLANQYSNGLLIGNYPEDKSNQVMVSTIVAEQICNSNSDCNNIEDLINQSFEVELVGMLADGSESKITATIKISGVYSGEVGYNDIILAYDGLNSSDTHTSKELSNKTLVDYYLQEDHTEIDSEQTDSETTSTTSEKEAAAHAENQEMLESAKANSSHTDGAYDQAHQVVEDRSNQIRNQFDKIKAVNSNATSYDHHEDQTRTGFTDGIFGDTKFASQYDVSETIEDNIVYRYYTDLEPVNKDNFTDDQLGLIERNGGDGLVGDGEYVALLNPQAKYSTLNTAKLTDGYDRGLVDGEYPVDGSDQAMISYVFASNLCDQRSACNNISDLIGTNYTIKLGGLDSDGKEQTISASLSISGIYYGSTFFNDIILAYDGLNESENNS